LKEILIKDMIEDPERKKMVRLNIEMKYNLLFGKPPGWGALPDWEIRSDETFGLPFTDNATKGLALQHYNLTANLLQLEATESDITSNDVFIKAYPFYHTADFLYSTALPFYKGAKLVITPSLTPSAILASINTNNVTVAHLPAHVVNYLSEAEKVEEMMKTTRVIVISEKVEAAVVNKLKKRLPKVVIKKAWCHPHLTPFLSINPYGSTRNFLRDTRVTERQSKKYVKGPQIPLSYFQDPAATQRDFDTDAGFAINDEI